MSTSHAPTTGLYSQEFASNLNFMNTFQTIENSCYVATVTGEATITDKASGLVLAQTSEAGQTPFLALGRETVVSDSRAVVIPAPFKGISPGTSSGKGGIAVSYDRQRQLPAAGLTENYVMHGWMLTARLTGKLTALSLEARSDRTIEDPGPKWLAVWRCDGNDRALLGISSEARSQTVGKTTSWPFSRIDVTENQTLAVTAHATADIDTYGGFARLSCRVFANTASDGGSIVGADGIRIDAAWLPSYELSVDVPAGIEAQGVRLAEANAINGHVQDSERHLSPEERAAWGETASYFTKEIQTGNISHAVAETLTLTVKSNYWGKEPAVVVRKDSTGTVRYGSEMLTYTSPDGQTSSIGLPVLITHPENATIHLDASERAALDEWINRKDELLALLTQ